MKGNSLTAEGEKYRDRKGQAELDSGTQGLAGGLSLSLGQVALSMLALLIGRPLVTQGKEGFSFSRSYSKNPKLIVIWSSLDHDAIPELITLSVRVRMMGYIHFPVLDCLHN